MIKSASPNKALAHWAAEHKMTTQKLAAISGYAYRYVCLLLQGKRSVTNKTIGRLLVVFGLDGPAPAMADAMKAQQCANGNGNGDGHSAKGNPSIIKSKSARKADKSAQKSVI